MRKSFILCLTFGAMLLVACGNKTTGVSSPSDSTQISADTTTFADTEKVVEKNDGAELAKEENEKDENPKVSNAKSVQAGGTTITVGAPLAETLRKAKGVTFEYNADYGVNALVGKVIIPIPEDAINKAGQEFVNGILADIEPNIDFKLEYIKPSAKITDFEK